MIWYKKFNQSFWKIHWLINLKAQENEKFSNDLLQCVVKMKNDTEQLIKFDYHHYISKGNLIHCSHSNCLNFSNILLFSVYFSCTSFSISNLKILKNILRCCILFENSFRGYSTTNFTIITCWAGCDSRCCLFSRRTA